jgi:hypothetical protein
VSRHEQTPLIVSLTPVLLEDLADDAIRFYRPVPDLTRHHVLSDSYMISSGVFCRA